MAPGPLARIPRETKVASFVLALMLLQVGVLAALGFGQNERRRDDAEQALVAQARRTLANLGWGAVRQVAAHEEGLTRDVGRDPRASAQTSASAALRRTAGPGQVFTRAHLIDARGEPRDAELPPFTVPVSTTDAAARSRVKALLVADRGDAATAAAAAQLADDLERERSTDAVALALALECGARAAFASGDGNLALRLARRQLDRHAALRDDRGGDGDSEPFGPRAALVLCEVRLAGLPLGADADHVAFVDAVLERRVASQRLRGVLSAAGMRVERDDCRRLRAEAIGLRAEHQRRLEAGLAACDARDAALDNVRDALRAAGPEAWSRTESVRLRLADGGMLYVAPLPAGDDAGPQTDGTWTAVAFTAPAERLRATALVPEVDRLDPPEGTAIVVRDATGAAVAGRVPDGSPRVLAEVQLGAAFPGVVATAFLVDPAVIDREADAARRYWVFVLGAVVVAAIMLSLLLLREVFREMKLARMKSDFVSNLSHELRTPLTSLKMFVETLQEGRVRDEREAKECLDVIAQETDRLTSLVDRVLQFAAFSRGRAPIQLRSEDAGEIVRRAVALFRKRAEAAGASIEARVAPDLPEAILDRDATVQVILNLLDNAVKHAGHDGARIRVTARPHPPEGGLGIAILVEDDGPGIPERERDLVFEEFYRGDDTLSRRTQGAGLGLALSRRIVLAHGGAIQAGRSADLGGAAFRVVLPDAAAGRRLAVAAAAAQGVHVARRAKPDAPRGSADVPRDAAPDARDGSRGR